MSPSIIVPIGGRSDAGLSAPVISRLKKCTEFTTQTLDLSHDYVTAYLQMERMVKAYIPFMVLITADRLEMTAAACAAFNNHIPIAHLYAGIGNNIATLDDVHRHAITLWSSIQFCESEVAMRRVEQMMGAVGLKAIPYVVGITHLDDLTIDTTLVPPVPYDLALYNPPTYCTKEQQEAIIKNDSHMIDTLLKVEKRETIFIGPNPDPGKDLVVTAIRTQMGDMNHYYENLPRPQFLGLLKGCTRFITNSSTAIYEAPFFLKPGQIVMVRARNWSRDEGPFSTGASDKIVEVIKSYASQ